MTRLSQSYPLLKESAWRYSQMFKCTASESFRDLLLEWRGTRSQRVIGELAGLSGKIISRYECGELPPNENYVICIGRALGISDFDKMRRLLKAYQCDKRKRDKIDCFCCPCNIVLLKDIRYHDRGRD